MFGDLFGSGLISFEVRRMQTVWHLFAGDLGSLTVETGRAGSFFKGGMYL